MGEEAAAASLSGEYRGVVKVGDNASDSSFTRTTGAGARLDGVADDNLNGVTRDVVRHVFVSIRWRIGVAKVRQNPTKAVETASVVCSNVFRGVVVTARSIRPDVGVGGAIAAALLCC